MTERYTVIIDATVQTKEQLFARYTETIYLGYSGIELWAQFYDLLFVRVEGCDILVDVAHRDLSGLTPEDRDTYLEILCMLEDEAPGKLQLVFSSHCEHR